MFSLKNRVAIVTGSGSEKGIGRATACMLARQNAAVVVADINFSGAETTAKTILDEGGNALPMELDVTSQESVDAMIKKVMTEFGRIDILVNNAGISQKITFSDLSMEDVRRMFEINFFGVFRCMKAVMEIMKKQKYGRIISLSSLAGKAGDSYFGGPHYAASKAAILGLSKKVAREVARDGITVNCVSPGLIDTLMWSSLPKEEADRIVNSIPVGRAGMPGEVAATILFLASDEAADITGEDIDINGGGYMD